MIALVDTDLRKFVKDGNFTSECDILSEVQPAGIDLPLGSRACMIANKFIPFRKKISYVVGKTTIEEFDLTDGAVFYKGHTYIVKIGDIKIPKGIVAKVSPKSSIGRIDLMVRAVCDNSGLYDFIPEDTSGELWLEITPQSFNVKVYKGTTLTQLRLFDTTVYESSKEKDNDAVFVYDNDNKRLPQKMFDKKLILHLAVDIDSVVGYEALPVNNLIDLKKTDHEWRKFFKKIEYRKDRIILEKDKFYILYTKEIIKVPNGYSLEMVPFSHLVGELRAHYAGFFDPGFGMPNGASGVLEIRPHENLVIYDGQPICLMEIYKNKSLPEKPYGIEGHNYNLQRGPRLAKYFKIE